MGPIFQATTLSLLLEMGRLNRHKIAKLPEGKRKIYGGCGQLRVALCEACQRGPCLGGLATSVQVCC